MIIDSNINELFRGVKEPIEKNVLASFGDKYLICINIEDTRLILRVSYDDILIDIIFEDIYKFNLNNVQNINIIFSIEENDIKYISDSSITNVDSLLIKDKGLKWYVIYSSLGLNGDIIAKDILLRKSLL